MNPLQQATLVRDVKLKETEAYNKSYNIVWILSTRLHCKTVKTKFDGKMTKCFGNGSMSKLALSAVDMFKTWAHEL